MYLSDYSQNAVKSQQARRRIRYLGTTPSGDRLWSPKEDELCREYGADYSVLIKKLPQRSFPAIKQHCQKLGLRRRQNAVTSRELSLMRRIIPLSTSDEIRQAFPHRTLENVRWICRYYGIQRKRKPYRSTGSALIDDIRARCFEANMTMADLDDIAGTKGYFYNQRWSKSRKPNYTAICKAVAALDGEISVRWRDE